MHNITTLPDKRTYETFTDESERNIRYNQLKKTRIKIETGFYDSVSWRIYFLIYKE